MNYSDSRMLSSRTPSEIRGRLIGRGGVTTLSLLLLIASGCFHREGPAIPPPSRALLKLPRFNPAGGEPECCHSRNTEHILLCDLDGTGPVLFTRIELDAVWTGHKLNGNGHDVTSYYGIAVSPG